MAVGIRNYELDVTSFFEDFKLKDKVSKGKFRKMAGRHHEIEIDCYFLFMGHLISKVSKGHLRKTCIFHSLHLHNQILRLLGCLGRFLPLPCFRICFCFFRIICLKAPFLATFCCFLFFDARLSLALALCLVCFNLRLLVIFLKLPFLVAHFIL